MPLLLGVNELRAGMSLADDYSQGFNVLVPRGRELKAADIDYIKKHTPKQYISILTSLDQLVEFEDIGHDIDAPIKIGKDIIEAFKQVSGFVQQGKPLRTEQVKSLEKYIHKAASYLSSSPTKTFYALVQFESGDYLGYHTSNVFYLSLMLGGKLRNYIMNERQEKSAAATLGNSTSLIPLALGAFYHDIALVNLEAIWQKDEALSEEEIAKVKSHPEEAGKLLDEKLPPLSRQTVLSHHENWDGSGYPKGARMNKINIYARIVRVADAFCAATAEKVYQEDKSMAAVLHEMLYGKYRDCYDPGVMEILPRVIQPFPIGSRVGLQTGATGIVVKHIAEYPFSPDIIIAFDKAGKVVGKATFCEIISLRKNDDLKIVEFHGEDVSYIHERSQKKKYKIPMMISRNFENIFDLVYP